MVLPSVAVVGSHRTPPRARVDDLQLEEMVFQTVKSALADADLTIDDIDGIVIGVNDQAHGRVIESMVLAGSVGAVGRDLTTLASGPEHALVYAYLRLRSGQGRRILTVAWGKPSEAKDRRHGERVSAEPLMMRGFGLTDDVAAGLQASAYRSRYGDMADEVDAVREARAERAMLAYGAEVGQVEHPEHLVAWPLQTSDLPRHCDMAAAMVLAVDEAVSDDQVPAWITGVGWATDAYDLGTRDLSSLSALKIAAQQAEPDQQARRTREVVEVQELSTVGSFAACEALGLASPGEGATVATSAPQINPSGGNLPAHGGVAAGFIRFVEAAAQVRGRAGPAQLTPRPSRALGAAVSGFAGQAATVVTFDAQREVGR